MSTACLLILFQLLKSDKGNRRAVIQLFHGRGVADANAIGLAKGIPGHHGEAVIFEQVQAKIG